MTQQLIILLMFSIGCMTYVNGANYSLPVLKDEVTSTWTLSAFASLVRDAILSANPFPWDFVKRTLETDNDFDLMASAQEVVMIELPLLIPFMLGLLCAVFLPIVSLMFCCCRCCCKNCGAKLTTTDIRKQKPVPFLVNVLVVMLMIGILCAMGSSIPPSGDRLKTGPRIIYRVIEASLDDLKLFLDVFVQDASDLAKTTLNTTIETIKTELDDLPDSLAESVTDGAAPYVEDIENKIGSISDGITSLKTSESSLNATVDNIVLLVAALQTGLTNINDRWTSLKSQCETDGETFCTLLPVGTGPSSLGINIDTTELTDMKDTVSEVVSTADAVDLSQYQNLANTTFTEIPGTIRTSSQSAIDGVKVTLDGVPAEIEPVIDTALQAAQVDMDFSSILDPLNEYIVMLEEQYSLLHTIFLAVGGVLIVLSLIVFAGCSLGTLCTRSTGSARSGRTKAGHCGANLIMLYVCVAVLPVMISLLVGSVMMLVGANMTIICQPLQDLSMFEQIVDNGLIFGGDSLGKTLMNDESFNVSISYMFKTCRKNETVFKGLNIQSGMDLSSHFDVGEFVPAFGDDLINQVNTTIDGISVVNTSLFNDLSTKLDLLDIDTSSISTIIADLTNLNLTETSQTMADLADSLTHGDYKSAYQAISLDLQNLHDNTTEPLITAVNSVQLSVDGINSSCVVLKTIITDLSTSLNNLTSFIGSQAVTVIVQALNDFLSEMLEVPENMINSVLDTLGADVGHCQVLADIYDTFLAAVCEYSLDSYNTLWAAFYTGGMVAVILMICSCTLTKYFRTPNDLLQTRINQHQNIGYHAHPAGSNHLLGGSDIILTHFKNFNVRSEDENNNAVTSTSNHYQRINQRWRQRRKFVTGPFTAQLFKTMGTNNKVLPEPYETSTSLSPIPTLNVDQETHIIDVQGVNDMKTADNEVKVYDLENYPDSPVCNKDDDDDDSANKVDNVSDYVTGIEDNKKKVLEHDSMNVSDDNAIKNFPRNGNGHNYDASQSDRFRSQELGLEHNRKPHKYDSSQSDSYCLQDLGLEHNRDPTVQKKSILNITKNFTNVLDKRNDGGDTGVNIKDAHFLFPASRLSKEKKDLPIPNCVGNLENETKLKTNPKKICGGVGSELWLKKYRIKEMDCLTVGNSNSLSDQLSKECFNNVMTEDEPQYSSFIYSKYSAGHTPVKVENSEHYTSGKIVCALCKNKVQQHIYDIDSNSNCINVNHGSAKNTGEMLPHHGSHPPSVVPPDVIVDIGDRKTDRDNINTLSDTILSGNPSSNHSNKGHTTDTILSGNPSSNHSNKGHTTDTILSGNPSSNHINRGHTSDTILSGNPSSNHSSKGHTTDTILSGNPSSNHANKGHTTDTILSGNPSSNHANKGHTTDTILSGNPSSNHSNKGHTTDTILSGNPSSNHSNKGHTTDTILSGNPSSNHSNKGHTTDTILSGNPSSNHSNKGHTTDTILSGNPSSNHSNRGHTSLFQAGNKYNQQNGKSKYSTGKLDVKVQPYKCQQRPLSPRGAFLFWKYIDGSCASVEELGMPHTSNTVAHSHVDNVTLNSGLDFVHPLSVSETLSNIKTNITNNVNKASINGLEAKVQLRSELSSVNQLVSERVRNNIPDSLQMLSIRAGQQVHCQNNPDDIYYYQTSQLSLYNNEECPEVRSLSQPKSLSDLATMAIVNTEESVFYPKPSRTYGSASTRRANIPLTYC